eukprot:5778291-Amphidinium_carterae.1
MNHDISNAAHKNISSSINNDVNDNANNDMNKHANNDINDNIDMLSSSWHEALCPLRHCSAFSSYGSHFSCNVAYEPESYTQYRLCDLPNPLEAAKPAKP